MGKDSNIIFLEILYLLIEGTVGASTLILEFSSFRPSDLRVYNLSSRWI
jgi:hypothetical protein